MIIINSYSSFFMNFRYTEEFNQVLSSRFFFIQFVLAWMFIGGLFQAAMVIMTNVNWGIYDKWIPVTTATCFLRLSIEKRPLMWRGATNILNQQMWTADRWWSSNVGVGRKPHRKIVFVTKHEHLPWTSIDTLIRTKQRKTGHGIWYLEFYEPVYNRFTYSDRQGISKI